MLIDARSQMKSPNNRDRRGLKAPTNDSSNCPPFQYRQKNKQEKLKMLRSYQA